MNWFAAVPFVAVLPIVALPTIGRVSNFQPMDKKPVSDLASWASHATPQDAMFLFPDQGRSLYPGIFRVNARRALWVDWKSGGQANYFGTLAYEWWARWQATMNGDFSFERLRRAVYLPVDYFVLKRSHRLLQLDPVYQNSEFIVYKKDDLVNQTGK